MEAGRDEVRADGRACAERNSSKKPWIEPEVIWYEQLHAVTLGIYCDTGLPTGCTSPAVTVIG